MASEAVSAWSGVAVAPATVTELRGLAAPYDGPPNPDREERHAHLMASAGQAIPPMYRRSPGDCWMLMQLAKSLNIAIGTATQNLFFENGQVGMRGALIWALIVRAGHRIETVDRTDRKVTLKLVRCDGQPGGTATWTLREAHAQGLTSRATWMGIPGPPTMLFWRCVARLGREYASDVLLGFGYLPDELADRPAGAAETSDRPVDSEVQELLVGSELLDPAGLRDLWKRADRAGLSDRYAGTVNGVEYTVAGLLAMMSDRAETTPTDDPAPGVDPDRPEPGDLPAGEGTWSCGCDAATVVTTGVHQPETCAFERAWDDQ